MGSKIACGRAGEGSDAVLDYIKISNFALIESAELEFDPGFNVVTGESGAGKSILMGAVELLLGGRVDRGVIRSGSERCEVAGCFSVPETLREPVGRLLEEAGIDFERELQLRRVISAGSVRNFLNDTPVSGRLLGLVGAQLIDLHGANEQLSLLSPARQLELLDRYAGAGALRTACEEAAAKIAALREEREAFEAELPDEAEASRLELQVEDIEKVNPQPGEDAELSAKYKLASNARQVVECAGALTAALTDGENALADQLGAVYRKLLELARIDETLTGTLLTDCDAIQQELTALSEGIAALADRVEVDAEALQSMEARMSELFTIKRRYGPSLEQVLEVRSRAEEQLKMYRETAARRAEFLRRETVLRDELRSAAQRLSEFRRARAEEFAGEVCGKLAAVGFPKSVLSVAFSETEPSANGMDRIEMLFSANPGEEERPLRRIASSGELSRLMLVLKTVLADADSIPVVIFDEIDSNIGGETANRVGETLRELGSRRQILCISHQPQVAARGARHFCVVKRVAGERTCSECVVLRGAEREREIARMLGGGASALIHARDVLREVAGA